MEVGGQYTPSFLIRSSNRTYAFALLGHVERSQTSRGILRFAQNDSKRVSPKVIAQTVRKLKITIKNSNQSSAQFLDITSYLVPFPTNYQELKPS